MTGQRHENFNFANALTKYERSKMKRDARQKCRISLGHLYFIKALVAF